MTGMQDKLIARREQAEASFNALVKQREQKEQEIKEIDVELNRLQGEYRVVDDLLKTTAKPSKVSPKAEVIDVGEATK